MKRWRVAIAGLLVLGAVLGVVVAGAFTETRVEADYRETLATLEAELAGIPAPDRPAHLLDGMMAGLDPRSRGWWKLIKACAAGELQQLQVVLGSLRSLGAARTGRVLIDHQRDFACEPSRRLQALSYAAVARLFRAQWRLTPAHRLADIACRLGESSACGWESPSTNHLLGLDAIAQDLQPPGWWVLEVGPDGVRLDGEPRGGPPTADNVKKHLVRLYAARAPRGHGVRNVLLVIDERLGSKATRAVATTVADLSGSTFVLRRGPGGVDAVPVFELLSEVEVAAP